MLILLKYHIFAHISNTQTHIYMRNQILLSILAIICSLFAYGAPSTTLQENDDNRTTGTQESILINKHLAARGYRGFFNYTPLTATFINDGISGNISTTHGYQINHNIFVGGGIGFHINLGDEGLGVAIPVYAAFKGNVGTRLAQFTYGARLGVSYADYGNFNSDTSIHNGETALAYINVNLGLRLGFTRYFAMRITPEIDIFTGKYHILGAGLRLGFEF